jgi:hypothetical protein
MPPPNADFSFRIAFKKGQGNPRRIFDAAGELIDGFGLLDEAVEPLPQSSYSYSPPKCGPKPLT